MSDEKSNIVQLHNIDPKSYKAEIVQEIKEEFRQAFAKIEPQPQKEYLTREEVAKLLKVSLVTLHSWCKKGILKSYKVGGKVRFLKHEVEASVVQIYK